MKNIIFEIFRKLNRIYNQLKNNFVYIIWFEVFFFATWRLLGGTDVSAYITIGIYVIILAITFSPIGEFLLRFFNSVRKLETAKEKEYLIPIFKEVCGKVENIYPKSCKKLEICIIDQYHVNALALGLKTIAVTKGAAETLSDDELKGIIANKIGHIFNGTTKALLFITIADKIFNTINLLIKNIIELFGKIILALVKSKNRSALNVIVETLLLFLKYLLQMIQILISAIFFTMQLTTALNSRLNEYRADKFAYDIGYGVNLQSALYILQGTHTSDKPDIIRKLKESQPIIPKRIGRLEKMIYRGE